MHIHEKHMHEAIAEARKAEALGEVPIGAVAVRGDAVIARAHNLRETTGNPLGHAEVLLLQSLADSSEDWRLEDVSIYVTCEPCVMCAGALVQARVAAVYFGCYDPKAGACGSLYNVLDDPRLNHQPICEGDVLGAQCGGMLSDFFRALRAARKGR